MDFRSKRTVIILLWALVGAAGLWLFFRFALVWFAPFLIAFVLSRLIEYPVEVCTNRLHMPRPVASFLMTALTFGILSFILYSIVAQIVREIYQLLSNFPDAESLFESILEYLSRTSLNILDHIPDHAREPILSAIRALLHEALSLPRAFLGKAAAWAASIAASLPAVFLFVFTVLIATYFFSSDSEKIKAFAHRHLPKRIKLRMLEMKTSLFQTLSRYLQALGIMLALTFAQLSMGFLLLGVKYALVCAFFVALIDALPILGTGTVLIPWALLSLLGGNFHLAIGLSMIYLVVTLVHNLIEPKVVGTKIGLHPLVNLMSVYIGIKLFGFWGIFTPIAVVLVKELLECSRQDLAAIHRSCDLVP